MTINGYGLQGFSIKTKGVTCFKGYTGQRMWLKRDQERRKRGEEVVNLKKMRSFDDQLQAQGSEIHQPLRYFLLGLLTLKLCFNIYFFHVCYMSHLFATALYFNWLLFLCSRLEASVLRLHGPPSQLLPPPRQPRVARSRARIPPARVHLEPLQLFLDDCSCAELGSSIIIEVTFASVLNRYELGYSNEGSSLSSMKPSRDPHTSVKKNSPR